MRRLVPPEPLRTLNPAVSHSAAAILAKLLDRPPTGSAATSRRRTARGRRAAPRGPSHCGHAGAFDAGEGSRSGGAGTGGSSTVLAVALVALILLFCRRRSSRCAGTQLAAQAQRRSSGTRRSVAADDASQLPGSPAWKSALASGSERTERGLRAAGRGGRVRRRPTTLTGRLAARGRDGRSIRARQAALKSALAEALVLVAPPEARAGGFSPAGVAAGLRWNEAAGRLFAPDARPGRTRSPRGRTRGTAGTGSGAAARRPPIATATPTSASTASTSPRPAGSASRRCRRWCGSATGNPVQIRRGSAARRVPRRQHRPGRGRRGVFQRVPGGDPRLPVRGRQPPASQRLQAEAVRRSRGRLSPRARTEAGLAGGAVATAGWPARPAPLEGRRGRLHRGARPTPPRRRDCTFCAPKVQHRRQRRGRCRRRFRRGDEAASRRTRSVGWRGNQRMAKEPEQALADFDAALRLSPTMRKALLGKGIAVGRPPTPRGGRGYGVRPAAGSIPGPS